MPTPINIQSEILRHHESNTQRMKDLVDRQYNTEITRPLVLSFTADEQADAEGLGQMLFAKGMRLLKPEPEPQPDGSYLVRVGVKHNLREVTQEDFFADLISVASGVHACYFGWDFLSDDSAEQTQEHEAPTEPGTEWP